MRWSRQQLIAAEVGGAILVVLLAFMFVFQPMLRSSHATKAEAQGLALKLQAPAPSDPAAQEALSRKQRHLAFRQAQLASLRERLTQIEAEAAREQDPAQLIDRFVKLATPQNVEVSSVKPADRRAVGDRFDELKFELALAGEYPDLVQFVDQLDTVGRPLYVETLVIDVEENALPKLRARATVGTLFPKKGQADGSATFQVNP